MLCAKAAGATTIVISDIDESRLKFAEDLMKERGGVKTVQVQKESAEALADRVKAAAGGDIDVAIECTGVESSLTASIYAVKFGGTVFAVGVGKNEQTFPFMILSVKEVDLKFQYRYCNTWPSAIKLLESGAVSEIRKLITHRFKLEDGLKAFETSGARGGGAIKVIISDE